jgi:hypothetical protein
MSTPASYGIDYDVTAFELRHPAEELTDGRKLPFDPRELVRMAALAASSHNTQPWKFRIEADTITILPDFTRRCPAADPDDSHLFRSLGCAAENLVHAATSQGLAPLVHFDQSARSVVVKLKADPSIRVSELYAAIPVRQCTRTLYAGIPVKAEELLQLQRSAVGNAARIEIFTSDRDKDTIIEYIAEGNAAQLGDRAFVQELVQWIRFNDQEALRLRDGLCGRVMGTRPAPRWLASRLLPLALRMGVRKTSQDDAAKIRSSSGVAVFIGRGHDEASWIQVGRAFERFSLRSALMGIRVALQNPPVEVPRVRQQFEGWLGLHGAESAQLVVRFGFAPLVPYSLRRPVEDVIVD